MSQLCYSYNSYNLFDRLRFQHFVNSYRDEGLGLYYKVINKASVNVYAEGSLEQIRRFHDAAQREAEILFHSLR